MVLLTVCLFPLPACALAPRYDYAKLEAMKKQGARKFCQAVAAHDEAEAFKYAFTRLYLNRDVKQANELHHLGRAELALWQWGAADLPDFP